MRPDVRAAAIAFALCGLLVARAAPCAAQQTDSLPRVSNDTLVLQARKLIEDGNPHGRKILDSLIAVSNPDDARYAEALYWRAALAAAAVDAERDYRRLLIEAPLSARAEDALLQLAQLEQARGDRRSASDHMQRFLLTYPNNPARPRVTVSLVRLLFDQGLVARGCEALRTGREAIPQENAELRNQLEFYAPRCVSLETAVAPAPAADTTAVPAERDTTRSVRREAAANPAPPARPVRGEAAAAPRSSAAAFYSVQVAAYETRESATRMARTLTSRGLQARVDGTARPFRVRIGKYATRADAVKAAATLKSQGINGFITLVKAGS